MRSFGPLEGGADAVIQAFLDLENTLIVPTFTYMCEIPIPEDRRIPQNGYPPPYPYDPAVPYRAADRTVSEEMGILPARVLARDDHIRGDHPLNSITGIGPASGRIIQGQTPLDVYAPYRSACEEQGALLILAGVDLTRATAVHYAEACAGRRLFRRWALLENGQKMETAVGSCSEGFRQLEETVRPIERRIHVAASVWRIYPLKDFIDRLAAAIREQPSLTACGSPQCGRCRDAVLGGPLI
jgi:aminoglycoside 3-N-acetyltransferase